MSEHHAENMEILTLDAETGAVMLSAAWSDVVDSRRQGDDLVVELSDGRVLLVEGYFATAHAIVVVNEADGSLVALNVLEDGTIDGVRPVSLAWLEEMFGIRDEDVEVVAEAEEEAVSDESEEEAEDQMDELALDGAAELDGSVETVVEAEADETAEDVEEQEDSEAAEVAEADEAEETSVLVADSEIDEEAPAVADSDMAADESAEADEMAADESAVEGQVVEEPVKERVATVFQAEPEPLFESPPPQEDEVIESDAVDGETAPDLETADATVETVRPPKSIGSYVDEAMVAAAGLSMTVLVLDDGDDEPARPFDERVEGEIRGLAGGDGQQISRNAQERMLEFTESVIPEQAHVPDGLQLVSATGLGVRGAVSLRADIDLDGDGGVDARTVVRFNSEYNPTGIEYDDNFDGTTFSADRIVEFTVGPDGRRSRSRFDDDADGTFDRVMLYGSNSDGDVVVRIDGDGDGVYERIDTITYDADGTSVVQVDATVDGAAVQWEERRYLDSDGKLVEVWVDENDDGTTDVRQTHHYNDIGFLGRVDTDRNLDGVDHSEYYSRGDGRVDRVEFYDRDAQGRVAGIRYDDDNDGTADWSVSFEYGVAGAAGSPADPPQFASPDNRQYAIDSHASRLLVDQDDDGTIDRIEIYEYYDSGFAQGRVAAISFDNDASDDGTVERRESYEYNPLTPASEQPFGKYIDDYADGTFESAEVYSYDGESGSSPARILYDSDYDGTSFQADRAETYFFNQRGLARRIEFDDDNDGAADRITQYRYGLDARIAEAKIDTNTDGTWDAIEYHGWNALGLRTSRVYDIDANGVPDRIETYQYDGKGRLIEIRLDSDANGNVDSSASIAYNSKGQVASRIHDYDFDGVAEQVDIYNYDEFGRLTELETWYAGTVDSDSGTSVHERIETLLYEDDVLVERRTEYDEDGDGTPEIWDQNTYGSDGTLDLRVTRYDMDEDGTDERMVRREWDENGNQAWTRFLYDDFDDHTWNRREYRTYDDDGRVAASVQEFDIDNDGVFDGGDDRLIHTAYSGGRPHILEVYEDFDGTMLVDRIAVYEYSQSGRLLRVKYDEDADGQGSIDFERVETYLRFEDGRAIRIDHDDDGDGVVEKHETRGYNTSVEDDAWHETSVFRYNDDGDPDYERTETLTYNRNGQVIGAEYDGAIVRDGTADALGELDPLGLPYGTADGTTDWIERTEWLGSTARYKTFDYFSGRAHEKREVYTYDEDGNIVRVEHDGRVVVDGTADSLGEVGPDGTAYGSFDGTVDWIETYEYQPRVGVEYVRLAAYHADDDGTPEVEVETEYHADGNIVRTHRWDDAAGFSDDGSFDRSEQHHFDGNERLTHVVYDSNSDGRAESMEAFEYDEQGRITVSQTTEYDNDGRSVVRTVVNEFDVIRRRVVKETVREYEDSGTNAASIVESSFDASDGRRLLVRIDDNADGNWETEIESTYRRNQGMDRVDEYRYDLNEDSTADRVERHTIGNNGRLTQVEFDEYYDGRTFAADRVVSYVYDSDGNIAREEHDLDVDGTADLVRVGIYNTALGPDPVLIGYEVYDDGVAGADQKIYYTFDESGRLAETYYVVSTDSEARVILVEIEPPLTSDGAVRPPTLILSRNELLARSEQYGYGEDGRIAETWFDEDGDGSVDRHEARQYDSGSGRLVRVLHDLDYDGTVDMAESRQHDDLGSVVRVLYDDNNDGSNDRAEAYAHNARGQVNRIERDNDLDGNADEVESRSIDRLGRIRASRIDSNADGIVDREDRLTYEGKSDRLTERAIDWDPAGRGTVEVEELRHYDERQRIERIEYFYYDDEGTLDNTADRTASFEYAGPGNRVSVAMINLDNDEHTDWTLRYGYDGSGQTTTASVSRDTDDDGTLDEVVTHRYVAGSRTVVAETHTDNDGTADLIQTYTYTAPVEHVLSPTRIEPDAPAGGDESLADTIEAIGFIETAQIERIETNNVMGRNDQTIDRIDTYHYSQTGQRIREDVDADADGTVDRAVHDANGDGTIDWIEEDYNDDGSVDAIYNDYFREGGGWIRHYDGDFDGTTFSADSQERFLVDSNSTLWARLAKDSVDDLADYDSLILDVDYDTTFNFLRVFQHQASGVSYIDLLDHNNNNNLRLATVEAEDMQHIESISLDGLLSDGSDPNVTLGIHEVVMEALGGGADGTIDNRYTDDSPYTIRIHGSTGDQVNFVSIDEENDGTPEQHFTRESSKDSDDGYHAYLLEAGIVVLVDPDITVTGNVN